jgi:uncharacterized damage-inducible protein DinB
MRSQIELLVDQMNRAFGGEAWHGPSLTEALSGVNGATASRRAVAGAHTIWELVLHVTVWKRTVERRLNGEALEPTGADDFPPMRDISDNAWDAAVDALRSAHESLVRTFQAIRPESLSATVPGKDYDIEFMMLGTVQHDCYHAGQIAILKKK